MSDADASAPVATKFSMFTGVFTPTLLTVLGVILYVRLGWVVGNAGLAGAFAILALAIGITVCTGLSMSSIATNTRLGAGGPYAMITRSLGLEVGGSIGVPLYLSRPLGIAMYIFGFREGWLWVFPDHDALLVDTIVFILIFGLAYLSANLAFRVQYLIMAVIAVSLLMVVMSPLTLDPKADITWFGDYRGFPETGFQGTDFWVVFAVFFPATTGILAGANMSGDLKNPRHAIPVGTLWAIGISSVIYFAVAYWLSRAATPDELMSNYTLLIDKSFWGPGVLAGLLGATFSSALAGAVGGPRILMAMAQHKLVPKSEFLAETKADGEPRNAVALTALLTLACVMLRDLNAIAPLVTMFFLITYLTINLVLLVESSLGLTSFRPTLVVPRIVPLLGAVGCVFCMFIVNPTFGLIAVGTATAIYIWIGRRRLTTQTDDVRSGVFFAVAEWAAGRVSKFGGERSVKAWKPNLLVPVEEPELVRGEFEFLCDVCKPQGSVKLILVGDGTEGLKRRKRVESLSASFHKEGAVSTWAMLTSFDLSQGVMNALETLRGSFFRPNILFLALPQDESRFEEYGEVIVNAHRTDVGVLLLGAHPLAGMGTRQAINLYVQPTAGGWDLDAAFDQNNLNLTLLMGYRLMRQWDAQLTLITMIGDEAARADAEHFLDELIDLARFPDRTQRMVMVGQFRDCVTETPQADLSILGLQRQPNFEFMKSAIEMTRSSCLFVSDSGRESARA